MQAIWVGHFTRRQHSQIAQKFRIINEIEVPKSEMNPGLMINHGDTNAYESLFIFPEWTLLKQTPYLVLVKHATELASPKFLLKLNQKMTLMGVFIISSVLGTFM